MHRGMLPHCTALSCVAGHPGPRQGSNLYIVPAHRHVELQLQLCRVGPKVVAVV
jgi:hypothetical protein